MSAILAKIETARLIEIKDELEKTPYPRLKKKLTDLGALDAWVSGEDKDVIIRTAIQILEKVGTEPSETVVEDVKDEVKPEPVVEVVEEKEVKDEIEPVLEPVIEKSEEVEETVIEEKIVETEASNEVLEKEEEPEVKAVNPLQNISKVDLQKNLDRVDALIKEAPDFHKALLFKKKKELEDRLIELGE